MHPVRLLDRHTIGVYGALYVQVWLTVDRDRSKYGTEVHVEGRRPEPPTATVKYPVGKPIQIRPHQQTLTVTLTVPKQTLDELGSHPPVPIGHGGYIQTVPRTLQDTLDRISGGLTIYRGCPSGV